jgi:hypothetical protein
LPFVTFAFTGPPENVPEYERVPIQQPGGNDFACDAALEVHVHSNATTTLAVTAAETRRGVRSMRGKDVSSRRVEPIRSSGARPDRARVAFQFS